MGKGRQKMSEFDFDAPYEDVINFEDLEQTEVGIPTKKEPIAKPKTGFNKNSLDIESFKNRSQQMSSRQMSSREEDRKLLVELMFVGEQLKGNIVELRKLDGIAQRAKALNEIDTEKIMDRLNSVSFTQIERKIVDTIREDLKQTRTEILSAADEAAAAAKDLSQKTELLKESSDSLLQIDNMASDLDDLVKSVKNWKMRNIYAAISLSLFFGIASGSIASYFILNLSNSEVQAIENAQILTPKFGKIGVLPHKSDPNMFYMAFDSQKLKPEVESFEQYGVRYIMFKSQK